MREAAYALLATLSCVSLLPTCHSQGEGKVLSKEEGIQNKVQTTEALILYSKSIPSYTGSSTVVTDSYTHNSTLTSEDSVPLGTRIILVCQVVGLPYGTPLSYTWTCPNGPCEVEGYYGRKVYNEHILAVNTTSTSDGGTYSCQVTVTGGQEATGSFTLRVNGMPCSCYSC